MQDADLLDGFHAPDPARFATTVAVRYDDLDVNQHVNHARYLTYIEECRLALRRHLNAALGLPNSLGWAIGAMSIRYHRSVLYPATLRVETQPIHVGTTSFSLGYGLFDGGACAVTASSRSVCLDQANGRPVALPDALAAYLRQRLPTR